MGAFGLVVVMILSLIALAAPIVAPHDPIAQYRGSELTPPDAQFLLGTDALGRDILSRIIYGARVSLAVSLMAVAIGAGVGVPSGLLAGYFGGAFEAVIMRLWDAVLAFPGILMGIAVVTVLGPGSLHVALAVAIVSVPQFSRLTRANVLTEREREYVQAARCIGASDSRIMLRHLFPNCFGLIVVQISLSMGFAVLLEAGLSFLGLGAQPPEPSWGTMLSDSRAYLYQAPWYGAFPGVALALLLLGLTFLSDAVRDALDPRSKRA